VSRTALDVKKAMMFHHLKKLKEEMIIMKKLENINMKGMHSNMKDKSLEDSRIEFLWRANMMDTRTIIKGKYRQLWCPHCREGWVNMIEGSPSHLMS
jgi:hypothetical protein